MRRPGVTLLEVLVSIFIMAIGMISLLVLFPLGALHMARAIRDGRAGDAAAEAAALANTFGVRNDGTATNANTVAGIFNGYLTAGPGSTMANPVVPADPTGPGYPVYVDPYYAVLSGQTLLGAYGSGPYNGTNGSTPGISRCSTTYVGGGGLTAPTAPASESPGPSTAANWAARYFTVKDDINLQNNGTPVTSSGFVERGGSYTWAYLLRRPKASTGADVELFVVVYAGRSVQIAAGETACAVTSTSGAGNAALGDTAVSLTVPSGTAPQLRRGAWLLDTSFEQTTSNTYGTIHGQFYRVVDVTGSASPFTVELDQPLKHNNVNVMVVMDNVVEVIYKGTGWRP